MKNRAKRARIVGEVADFVHEIERTYNAEDWSALLLLELKSVQRRTDPLADSELGLWIEVLDDMALIEGDNFKPFGIQPREAS